MTETFLYESLEDVRRNPFRFRKIRFHQKSFDRHCAVCINLITTTSQENKTQTTKRIIIDAIMVICFFYAVQNLAR